ncbi:MAG: hypothetical protein ABJF04_16990 [Reichenbachiella sp.]|uniref:hypothetical protein n=1 Tax=Reichenbachiella sp. TaxID=2184521 RepID=UPI003265C8EE
MKQLRELKQEINSLTLKMKQEYPELYAYLDENPITLPNNQNPDLGVSTYSEYLDSLKQLLKRHFENHDPHSERM